MIKIKGFWTVMIGLIIIGFVLALLQIMSESFKDTKKCDNYTNVDYEMNRIPYRCRDVIIFFQEHGHP